MNIVFRPIASFDIDRKLKRTVRNVNFFYNTEST